MLGSDRSAMKLGFGLAALASSAQALVLGSRGGAFSVDAIPVRAPRMFDPVAERNRLMSKYPTTELLENNDDQKRALGDQHGSVLIQTLDDGSSFESPTVIGNQTFNMIYDTGSADLWVYSDQSPASQNQGHPLYVPTSSAHLLQNHTFSIKYAGGASVNGTVYTDTVQAGPLVAHNQAVQAALNIPVAIDSDGILGLAPGVINTVQPVKQKTLFETLLPTLPQKVFAANFQAKGPGSWDFGFIDHSKFTGNLSYVPVVLPFKHWTLTAGQYSVGNGPLSATNDTLGNVIVDSGSSLIYLPDPVVKAYYNQVPGFKLSYGGVPEFPCNATLPDLHFKAGDDLTLTVPGQDINFGVVDPTRDLCTGAVATRLNMKYAVLGSVFMRNYYVVHSLEDDVPKLGFGSH
ncbi:hypothetical protein E4U55_007355 [Claviceps digitariae]|nr:hypothetical protein E4U55_007355 [Claviceps digitariae]